MYDALDIARYSINYLNEHNNSVSNLKLQKLLYFVQGFYLVLTDQACFSNIIEAWDFGPVVPDVYREFKEFGSNGIPSIKQYYVYDESAKDSFWKFRAQEFNDDLILDNDKMVINAILNVFKDYSATALVRMTHEQDPWKNAYNRRLRSVEITQESIKQYFKGAYLNG